MTVYQVKLTFTEAILGTVPKNKDIFEDHVQKAARNAGVDAELLSAEVPTVEEVDQKGRTGFHNDNDGPFLFDYVIRGFMKSACGALRRAPGTESAKIKAYKKIIDGLVFVKPRNIHLVLPPGEVIGELVRPLRAETAQGPRVALAASDTAPAGTSMEFRLEVLADKAVTEDLLREWLEYGQYMGLGQWRSGGYGTFEFEMS